MKEWRVPVVVLLSAVLVAGCVGVEDAGVEGAGGGVVPEGATERVTLVDWEMPLIGVEFDVACTWGGGLELTREADARVARGVTDLEVAVSVTPSNTGVQVGYALDNASVTWLPVVFAGDETHTIPVAPDAHEGDEVRWRFHYQLNVKGAEQECYTGAGTGPYRIMIDAVPGAEA